MARRKWMVGIGFLVVISLILTACTAPPAAPSGEEPTGETTDVIVVAMSQEPDTMYSLVSTMAVQKMVYINVNERFHWERGYNFQPNTNLWEDLPTLENGGAVLDDGGTPDDTSDDQLTMTYHMKPGLKWSDGEPLTVHDFVFGANVAADPESGATSYTQWQRTESYEALDDLTLQVKLIPGFLDPLYFLAYDVFEDALPMPEHAWSKYTPAEMLEAEEVARFARPSYGPYMIEEWVAGDHITMVANPNYYGAPEKPYIKTLIFRFIQDTNQLLAQLASGDVDVGTQDALQVAQAPLLEQFEAQGLINVHWTPSPTWEHIDMNLYVPSSINADQENLSEPHPILSDINVRKAIAYGTDRQGMVDVIYFGRSTVMHSWIPEAHEWAFAGKDQLTVYDYDPAMAMSLLDEAGWVDSDGDGIREKDGVRLSLTINTTAGNTMRERITQVFEQNMKAIGIEIIIGMLPASVWFADDGPLFHRDFELGEFAWVGEPDPSGETLYRCNQIPTPANNWEGQNFMGWCNEAADEAVTKANSTLVLQERIDNYLIVQQEFAKDMVSLPLFNRLNVSAARPDLIGFDTDPTEYETWNIAEWRIAGE